MGLPFDAVKNEKNRTTTSSSSEVVSERLHVEVLHRALAVPSIVGSAAGAASGGTAGAAGARGDDVDAGTPGAELRPGDGVAALAPDAFPCVAPPRSARVTPRTNATDLISRLNKRSRRISD